MVELLTRTSRLSKVDCCEAYRILSEMGDNPEFYEAQLTRHDPLYEELIRRTAVSLGARVLDLGTGTGPVAIKLARRVGPKGKVFGLDVNKKMLRSAKRKVAGLDLGNIEFKLMSMEDLRFPADSFDHVVSSYGICCCFHYDRTLKEAFRVLKSGGRITFSQDGPGRNPVREVFYKVLSKYETKQPSQILKKRREASALQEKMARRYQKVPPTLALMKKVGFSKCTCAIVKFKMDFSTPEDYLDYALSDSYQFKEMTPQNCSKLKGECIQKLARFGGTGGFRAPEVTAYFSGVK